MKYLLTAAIALALAAPTLASAAIRPGAGADCRVWRDGGPTNSVGNPDYVGYCNPGPSSDDTRQRLAELEAAVRELQQDTRTAAVSAPTDLQGQVDALDTRVYQLERAVASVQEQQQVLLTTIAASLQQLAARI